MAANHVFEPRFVGSNGDLRPEPTDLRRLPRRAIHNELVGRSPAATDAEERVAATLERVVRDVTRVARGQQALFAMVDTLVRTFLTCVPDPPTDAMPQSVARVRDRYARFVKAAGQAMVGDALAAMRDLVNHVE